MTAPFEKNETGISLKQATELVRIDSDGKVTVNGMNIGQAIWAVEQLAAALHVSQMRNRQLEDELRKVSQ